MLKVLKGVWFTISTLLSAWGVLITFCAIHERWVDKSKAYDAISKEYNFKTKAEKKKEV